jgi:ABC-type multidrug transport system ATPase subunit
LPEILQINALTKHYRQIHAVEALDLTINQGEVFGILGPNGSGKTTTLGMVLNLVNPTSGRYSWFGEPPSQKARQRIGATLEHPVFYPYLSAAKNLRIVARIRKKPFDDIDKVLRMVDLYERRDDKFRTYSLGMRQRLSIAATLIGQPEVLIFDEPTNGLDPTGIAEIRNLISRIAGEGKTIILASHLLDEVQKTCSHLAVLKNGKKLFTGAVDDMLSEVSIELSSENLEMLILTLKSIEAVGSVKMDGRLLIVRLKDGYDISYLHEMLIEKGIVLTHLALRRKTLEQQFLEILNTA